MLTGILLSEETISRQWLGSCRKGAMCVRTRCLWKRRPAARGEGDSWWDDRFTFGSAEWRQIHCAMLSQCSLDDKDDVW